MVKIIKYIEIIAWLMSVYDFYARVVKDWKRTGERSEQVSLEIFHNKCIMKIVQTNQPSNQVSYFLWHFNFFRGSSSDGRYYRKSIEIIDTYKSIDTFDTRKKYR
jgi:dissimilatory sulfite reductase (desulfoviridin) alpha/beta subunit